MQVIPAIDIIDGKCVRLVQGDYNRRIIYNDDPVGQAKVFEDCGAKLIHIVDLDGAKSGKPVNAELICRIAKSVKADIEIGGGIRSSEHIEYYLDNNVKRVIIGTKAVSEDFVAVLKNFSANIVAGVDARDGKVAVSGWLETTDVLAADLVAKLFSYGIREFIFTDIATDGMLQGPNLRSLEDLLDRVSGISLVASGGVSKIDDIVNLNALAAKGLMGCIVGKAYYDGKIDLKEAIRLSR